jgi:mono/diheme cytochrome c family protein
LAVVGARSQTGADPQEGLAVAQRVCAECHAVRREEGPSRNSQAPAFAALAATPGMTETALFVALTTPRAGMPMFRLTAEQRKDIIVYILSLR